MSYACRVVLDSVAPSGGRLTTFEVTFPRIVLAEFNTHRVFSRNSASSRAIPVSRRLQMVREDPFVPAQFGRNRRGMQATELLDEEKEGLRAESIWREALRYAVACASSLADLGVHKQHANRLLEPFAWQTVVVSTTHVDNYFHRRVSSLAQPEIERPSRMMSEALDASAPRELRAGDWHLPYVTGVDADELRDAGYPEESLVEVSAARCARVSYLTQDGKRDVAEDLALYKRLLGPGHMSPLEHPARALDAHGWLEHATRAAERWIYDRVPVGNFWGWAQHRKEVPHEEDMPAEGLS